MSNTSPTTRAMESEKPLRPEPPTIWRLWVLAWLCTALAGGVFGLVPAGVLGFYIGLAIASAVAIPVMTSFAIITWALWLSRYVLITVGLAGACTGYLAVSWLGGDTGLPAIAAALFGGAFSFIGSAIYLRGNNWSTSQSADRTEPVWQFSLRDLFLRFTAVSILIAVWTAVLAKLLR